MKKKDDVTRAHIGSWGELLVQQDLLGKGVDSARLTSDYGIDLIAYDRQSRGSFSVQVKTRTPRQHGKYYSWGVEKDHESLPDLFAFVVMNRPDARWYLTREEFKSLGVGRLGMRVLRFYPVGAGRKFTNIAEFGKYKGQEGLGEFLESFRFRTTAVKAKAAGR